MALDLTAVGYTTPPHTMDLDPRTLAVYALGVGAKRDELAFLYENAPGGMQALPTFAVIPAQATVGDMLRRCNANLAMVVHGGQVVRLHRPIPPGGTLVTTGRIQGIYDLKRFGQVQLETSTTQDGEVLCETAWSIIVREVGGFGGPRRPQGPDEPCVPKDRAPDWSMEETTLPEQALLYRLSGDLNPLHADPAFAATVGFPQGPILHGLCTYGHVGRALLKHAAGGEPSRIKMYAAQFRKPVWPGDTLVTQGWDLGNGTIAMLAHAKGRPEPVLTNAWAAIG